MPPPARSVGWKIAGAGLALVGLVAGSGPAWAVDWQVLYRLSEALRLSDNIELREDPQGAALSSHSGAGLDIAARTPTVDWVTSGDIGRLIYFGEGAPEDRKRTTVRANSDLLKRTRSTDFNLDAHFSMAPATGTALADPLLPPPELGDLGIELVNFDRIRYGAGGGFVHHLTRRDDLALSGRAERVDFTGDALNAIPHIFAELSGVWTRKLTRLVDGRAQASVGHFRSEDEDDLRRRIYNLTVGSNIRATHLLTLDANAGAAIIDQRLSGGEAGRQDVSVGLIGDISLIYTPWRDTSVTLALSQQVTPDALGDLRTVQAARGAITYQINERSSFNVTGAFTDSSSAGDDGGDSRQAWTVSPSYTHALTRSWDVTLGYRWLKSNDAESNTAFLTLSHHGTLLP